MQAKLKIKENYNHTIYASFIGYIVQAIINNLAPLLFLTFQRDYKISLDKVALLVTFNFGIQILIDLLSAKFIDKIELQKFMILSGILCFISYLMTSLSASPILGLTGCALCGLSVGIMWPGTFSISACRIKGCGTVMFALLALAGDLGCSAGPTLVGLVSGMLNNDLKKGILAAIIFPIILIGVLLFSRNNSTQSI